METQDHNAVLAGGASEMARDQGIRVMTIAICGTATMNGSTLSVTSGHRRAPR
ncbi:MAG: hypothetical protein OXP09_04700 [Gammaproteobacteria bacterium]|nr:hypothetical protein [Gammaproteobacteria bacterium]